MLHYKVLNSPGYPFPVKNGKGAPIFRVGQPVRLTLRPMDAIVLMNFWAGPAAAESGNVSRISFADLRGIFIGLITERVAAKKKETTRKIHRFHRFSSADNCLYVKICVEVFIVTQFSIAVDDGDAGLRLIQLSEKEKNVGRTVKIGIIQGKVEQLLRKHPPEEFIAMK